ncbi:MAG TPA: NUDIX hydrolase [Candidatus Saccharimonadales bacterium]|nr:NUDIX hydrolase [Candidatus Saccharimonadales bacterium]
MIACTFENGNKADPGLRHVTVGAIAYNEKGQVLLVKRSEKYSRPGTWTVPGGFLDRDRTVKEAVLKELKEESGVDGKIEALFHINDNPNRPHEDRQNVDFIYLVKVTSNLFSHDDEITQVAWFDKNTLPSEEEFAFDHRATILKFFEYLEKSFPLPLLGKL